MLARRLGDPSLECALYALARIGLEPGSAELRRVVDLLRGKNLELALEAADILAGLGPKVRADTAPELTAALRHHGTHVEARARLSLALWRITGRTSGLVAALVASRARESRRKLRRYRGGTLGDVLARHPTLIGDLVPSLRARGTRAQLVALGVLISLGRKARPLSRELRRAVSAMAEDDEAAASGSLALFGAVGDSGPGFRVARRLLTRDPMAGMKLLSALGPAPLPLVDEVLKLHAKDPTLCHAADVLASAGVAADAKTVPVLTILARSNDWRTRYDAINGLQQLTRDGSQLARAALETIAGQKGDSEAKRDAREALAELRNPR